MANDLVLAILLAIIQGITEWFPVSSSGHLVLFERIFGYEGGLLFEVALHFGTLMAVFVYFGKDITDMFRDFFTLNFHTENGRLAILLIIASIPAAIVGFLVKDYFDTILSDFLILGFGFAITGVLLFIVSFDFRKPKEEIDKIGYFKAFLIGIAQAIAIVPGISRSGATISSGVLLGLNEKNAMKFSFLMSIPIIFGANILVVGNNTLPKELIWATLVSFLVGLLFIHLTFKYLLSSRKNFRWFALYALLLGIGVIVYSLVSS